MIAGTLSLVSVFKTQVLVKAFFKLEKKHSQSTSETNKRKDPRLLRTHSSGTCSVKHHRNTGPKANI